MDKEADRPWSVLAWILAVLFGTGLGVFLVLAPPEWSLRDGAGKASQRLRVGYSIELPFASIGLNGRVYGEAPDVLRALLAASDLPEPEWVHLEFGQLIHELRLGRIDLIAAGLFITAERARQVAFTRPTARVQTALLVAAFNPMGLHSLDDLRERPQARLAVIRGSVEESLARAAGLADSRLIKVPDVQSGFAAVRSSQVAGFALSAPSLRWAMRISGAPGGELAEPFAAPPGEAAIGLPAFAMRPDDARLPRLPRLDQALSQYLGSAAHRKLAEAYGFLPDEVIPAMPAKNPPDEAGGRPR